MNWLMEKLFGKETLLGQTIQAEQNMMEEWARNPRSFDPVERKWMDHEARLKHLESQVGTRKGGGDEIV